MRLKHQHRVLSLASLGCLMAGLVVVLTLHEYCYSIMRTSHGGYTSALYFRIVNEWYSLGHFLIAGYCLVSLGLLFALPISRTLAGRLGIGMVSLVFLGEVVLHTCVHAPPLH